MLKLTVKQNSLGVIVYDEKAKDRIDVFPYDKDGKEEFVRFLNDLGVSNAEEYWP